MADDFPDLAELQSGTESAWTKAFQALWPIVLHAAGHPAPALNKEDVEEAANDALAQLVPLVSKVASFEELKALAVTLAYRSAISRARHNSAQKRGAKITVSLDGHSEFLGEPYSVQTSASSGLTNDELARLTELLNQTLAALDEENRALLLDNVLHELTCKQLSEKYEMPIGTVSAKLSRGLKRIRASLPASPGLLQQLREFLR